MPNGPPDHEPQRGLAQAVQMLRESAGLSPAELARRAGISVASLGEIESGDHDPTWGDMRRVAMGLGVSMEVLADVAEENDQSKS